MAVATAAMDIERGFAEAKPRSMYVRGWDEVALLYTRLDELELSGNDVQEFLHADRLGEEVVGAEVEALNDVLIGVQRRKNDDADVGRFGVGSEAAQHFIAVYLRHHKVKQNEGRPLLRHGRPLVAVRILKLNFDSIFWTRRRLRGMSSTAKTLYFDSSMS